MLIRQIGTQLVRCMAVVSGLEKMARLAIIVRRLKADCWFLKK